MHQVYLSLGSNLGRRKANLEQALDRLSDQAGRVLSLSPVYESQAWGFESQNAFLNCCLELETGLEARALLRLCQEIELDLGREHRGGDYADRLIDIDILFFDDLQIDQPGLRIPHPLISERAFVLRPLADIAPGLLHTGNGLLISELLDRCSDSSVLKPFIDGNQNA